MDPCDLTWTVDTVRTRDGRALHAERAGTGTPTVVFEAGMGTSRNCWGAVAPAVAAHTSVVVYDRSGLGRSAGDSAPRTLARLVDDLTDLLDHLIEGGGAPFVLVGFSWGGPIVRGAAAARPGAIGAMVLVDPSDEHCDSQVSVVNERMERWSRPLVTALGRMGMARSLVKRQARSLPEPWATALLAEDGTPAALRTYRQEVATSIPDLRRLRDHPWSEPDVPLTILSGGQGAERRRRAEFIAAHRARVDARTVGRHVIAPNSSHLVPFTDPQLVVDEVTRIVHLPTGAS